jgi:hypothetical protein
MASETTYSCDRCGKKIESEENERDKPLGPIQRQGEGPTWHPLVTVSTNEYDCREGEHYPKPGVFGSERESLELCYDCGRRVKRAIADAMDTTSPVDKALEFYGDEKQYEGDTIHGGYIPVVADNGKLAKQALEKLR